MHEETYHSTNHISHLTAKLISNIPFKLSFNRFSCALSQKKKKIQLETEPNHYTIQSPLMKTVTVHTEKSERIL
jgi:hypothetical protein